MTCPRCGHENRARAKFCEECGHPIAVAPGTGAARFGAPGSYTPRHLAERILSTRAALEGERKQVTVLFADLKGSMELLADRDPEDARKILDPVLELMMEAVHRYEGTVNQVMGDGIMALFGAPVAHEDHAVRAAYASLRMQDAVRRYAEEARRAHGVTVQIRVGINSGEVVVRAIGGDLHMDYTAVGQTTHLAARMEQLAPPGSILATASTLELVGAFVAVKPLGPVPVKGLTDTVEVYEVTGAGPAQTRLEAAARRGLTRFVGRTAEVAELHRALALAVAEHGQVVAVLGEAGVGKSRLLYELVHSHRTQGWLVLETTCVSYGRTTGYLPVIELLKRYFKIHDQDDLRDVREKVTGKLLTLDRALEPALPALLALLGVPGDAGWQALDPGRRRQRILAAVRELLLREAREQPLLLIVEDLHWIDGETQALLDGLVEGLGPARVAVLVNYRPEYQHGWTDLSYVSLVRLEALPADSAGELLETLLGNDPGLDPLKRLLVRRGNPFYLEETVRTLVDTGALVGERGRYRLIQPVHALQVPATVQAILAARIDRLPVDDRHLLLMASVVGKRVPLPLLQAIVDLPDDDLRRGLDHLQAGEFLHETRLYPDIEYAFQHPILHEVAYGSLLHERRRELHARIVGAIENLYRDRLGGEIERLAHHALRAELGAKAARYAQEAGLKAAGRSALAEARTWLEQALAVLAGLPESPSTLEQACDLRLDLRPIVANLGDVRTALERTREAEALADRLDDDHRRGRVSALMTNIHSLLGHAEEALAAGMRAWKLAERLGDLRLRILSRSYLEQVHYYRGDYAQAIALAVANLDDLPADWTYEYFGMGAPPSIWDRAWQVMSLAQLGRFGEATAVEAEAIRLAEPTHHASTLSVTYFAAGTHHLVAGNWPNARAVIERWVDAARTGNVVLQLPWAVASSAWAAAELGETNEALARLHEGEGLVDALAERGIVGNRGWAYQALGRAALRLGRREPARRLAERALESSPGHHGFEAHVHHLLGDIAASAEQFDAEAAEGHYRQALAGAEPRGMQPLIARCHGSLAALWDRTGQPERAREHVTLATTLSEQLGMGPVNRARKSLGPPRPA